MREQEKMMDDMVRLCFEDFGRLSLNFGEQVKTQKEAIPPGLVEFEKIKKQREKNGR